MKQIAPLAALLAMLAACNGAPPSTTANSMTSAGATEPAADNIAAATPSAAPTSAASPLPGASAGQGDRDYAGRWIGVEGTYLNVTPTGPGTASLEMQYDLDNKGTYPATVTPAGLRFTRKGKTLVLRPSDGNATGLKWLAGKKDCLTVTSGEGYCRA
ncbi:hypothetical protein KZ810_14925 [Sphingomonas sp. RHCKR47]|uniref:hypothetical protein n=1 Tax=Sphingomonas citricola TaxID=2862498 RepID=UPI001CA5A014|nr:hypothetical protein [Sphingomonas citricola]MBW6524792.1 hypothetical protein [Sphingomonas citricola]